MSGDIVKRLRVPPDLMTDFGRVGLFGEAAVEIERLRARVEVLERVREAAQRAQECWGILFAFPLIDKPFDDLRAALKEAKP